MASYLSASSEPALSSSRRFTVPGLRWWIAGLLTCITVINYLDRSALAVVGPTLKKELAIDEISFSYIIIAFQLVYGVVQPFAGRFIDWLNIRVGYSVALIWWSLAQALCAFATGWRSLALFRGVLGVGVHRQGAFGRAGDLLLLTRRLLASGHFFHPAHPPGGSVSPAGSRHGERDVRHGCLRGRNSLHLDRRSSGTSLGYGPLFLGIAFFDVIGALALWGLMRAPTRRAGEVAA